MWASDNIAPGNTLFYSLYYYIISLISLKITQVFHLLLGFAENQTVFLDFKVRNSVRITEGWDNGDLDNRGPIVYYYYICTVYQNPTALLLCIHSYKVTYHNLTAIGDLVLESAYIMLASIILSIMVIESIKHNASIIGNNFVK